MATPQPNADPQNQLRDFYDEIPYPNVPISASVSNSLSALTGLFPTSFTTAQYLRTHEIESSEGKVMLNAGCGSGIETLALAEANPGAKIIAADISWESVKLTEQRLRYHGFFDLEYYVLDLRALPSLGYQYDFITCNDVLYLLDDPLEGLQALTTVLSPNGILRANLHHFYGRREMLEAQQAMRILGQFDLPKTEAVQNVKNFLSQLVPTLLQGSLYQKGLYFDDGVVANNFLLYGDKGFTILEVAAMLKAANLSMVTLVDFPTWNLDNLFTGDPPDFYTTKLNQLSLLEKLHIFELLSPHQHRLIDFWAEKTGTSLVLPWSDEDWQFGILHLNPLLCDNISFCEQIDRALLKKQNLTLTWPGSPSGQLDIAVERLPLFKTLLNSPTPVTELILQAQSLAPHGMPPDQVAEDLLTYFAAIEDFALVLLGSPNS